MPSLDEPQGPVRRAVRWAVEVLPGFAVALALLPHIIANGSLDQPATIDLQVYVGAANQLLAGSPIYDVKLTTGGLQFIYPPIAAILAIPLTWLPYPVTQVGWTLATVAAQQAVLRRASLPRGWRLGVLGAVLVATFEPLRTTLGYGQVNTLVMWLVVADLLPDAYRPRRLPRGTLIGLAAAIKLTPLLFVVFLAALGLWRAVMWATASFVGLSLAGLLVGVNQAWWFWTHLGAFEASGTLYVGNQALSGVAARLVTRTDDGTPGVVVGMALALVACVWAAWLYWRGARALAVGVVGCASALASPLSWTHHYVWAVLIFASLIGPTWGRPRPWLQWALWPWVIWIAVCPPLAFLPYASHVELDYTGWQQMIANIGPLWLSAIIVAGAIAMIFESRASARRLAAIRY